MNCNHEGFYVSHPPTAIQIQNGGALLVTCVQCTKCGDVEYRSPPLLRSDEEQLEERMKELVRREQLLPNSGSSGKMHHFGKKGVN